VAPIWPDTKTSMAVAKHSTTYVGARTFNVSFQPLHLFPLSSTQKFERLDLKEKELRTADLHTAAWPHPDVQ